MENDLIRHGQMTTVKLVAMDNTLQCSRYSTKEENLQCVLEAFSLLTGLDSDAILIDPRAELYLYSIHGGKGIIKQE